MHHQVMAEARCAAGDGKALLQTLHGEAARDGPVGQRSKPWVVFLLYIVAATR